jgi:shikimate kinase
MSRNIALVGFMGTGKSSVGKVLAKKTGRRLVDIDREIETAEKRKIADIFASDGEARFRALEKEAIARASSGESAVITTGGGAVTDPANLAALKTGGVVVALWATPETIYRRVKDSKNRPLLNVDDVPAEIRRLLESRRPFYEKADHHFHTDGRTASQVAGMILEKLKDLA